MASVVYEGSVPAVCRDLGAETGGGDLVEPGRVYDVTDGLAERLIASGGGWRDADLERDEPDGVSGVEPEDADDEGEE